jgi:hypothetical protein
MKHDRSVWAFLALVWALYKAKRQYPEMRMGQILVNAYAFDLFYIEDRDLAEHVEGWRSL